ncbi:MAG: phenylacetic acid degradation protein [Chloroflexota bacterium]
MIDNQWPRWEVFKKDSDRKPHQSVGSIHAADPEHALLNARNVYVRRPSAVSLWVVLTEQIFSKTREELEHKPLEKMEDAGQTAVSYCIFRKFGNRRRMVFMDHIGQVDATSPENALLEAINQFGTDQDLAWWIFPESAVVKSEAGIEEAWFAPAKTKSYKKQSKYGGAVEKIQKGNYE